MKKNLIFSLCILGVFASCQKEKQKTNTVKTPVLGARHLSAAPTYTDFTQNPDGSYIVYWHSCGIKVTNPSWDVVKYPTLVNGVPVLAGTLTTYDGTSSVDNSNTGPQGNVFQVTQEVIQLTVFNSTAFTDDLISYNEAYGAWTSGGMLGAAPDIDSYVKDSYSYTVGSTSGNTYTGKLIRVTTGSNLAIADMSYPVPASTALPPGSLTCSITDPSTHLTYTVTGTHNLITGAKIGGTTYQATGSYTTDSSGNITAIGTIFGTGGKFNFNVIFYI